MARSAELLKYTYPQWNIKVETDYINWVKKLLLPHLRGETEKYKLKWGFYNNWHTSILEARLQFGLLCNDLNEVNYCISEYQKIVVSYVKDNGFTGETLRDSDHCCFGLAGMIQICEILYHQGINLYCKRLFNAIELHANIYACNYTPPGYSREQFNIRSWIQPSAWEIAFCHFSCRQKLNMPCTQRLLEKIRPCNFELHWGFDTLTHCK
jgi:hypothetical protein